MNPINHQHLRPLERRVLAMRSAGLSVEEIAERICRSPGFVERLMKWIDIPRNGPPQRLVPPAIERRIVTLRVSGETHEMIATRFGRSARFIRQVEGLTYMRHGLDILIFDRGRDLLKQAGAEARQSTSSTSSGGGLNRISTELTPPPPMKSGTQQWQNQHS